MGRHISHKFIDEDSQEEVWYEGYIVGYNAATRMHELAYVEEEIFFYDLTDDLHDGDIVFFDEEDDYIIVVCLHYSELITDFCSNF